MAKITEILASAQALREMVQKAVKNRDFLVSNHVSERTTSGAGIDYMNLAVSRETHIDDICQIIADFFGGKEELKDAIAENGKQGVGPVLEGTKAHEWPHATADERQAVQRDWQKTFAWTDRPTYLIGRRGEQYVYFIDEPAPCLKDYLERTGISENDFLNDANREILECTSQVLKVNEVYRFVGKDNAIISLGKPAILDLVRLMA